LGNSLTVAFLAAAAAFLLGLPVGVSAAFYEFPGRKFLLAFATLPLVVPSVLWAIGWSALLARFGPASSALISGMSGCILIFFVTIFPLVLLVSYAACDSLSGSQLDAARLAGGEQSVLWYAIRYAVPPALLAAGLGGALSLSDSGPGQILGLRTAAAEIMTSFSAHYDFALAARQCLTLTMVVLAFSVPLARFAGPRIANEMFARQTQPWRRYHQQQMSRMALVALSIFILIGVFIPILGLILPLLGGGSFLHAFSEINRTAGSTLVYALGSGIIAMVLGFLMAFFVGRQPRLRSLSLGIAFALFSLPPAMSALGLVYLSADSPAWTDPILRSRVTVCFALGLRFFPVAFILGLRAWGAASPSWVLAAGVHGVPLSTYLRRVASAYLRPLAAVAILLTGLLATADIGTVLLLHPPGEASLPLVIFTIMANAPESLVGSLCLAYILIAAVLLMGVWFMAELYPRQHNTEVAPVQPGIHTHR
jgi:ABC-type Fe3+ transport system permease subunit